MTTSPSITAPPGVSQRAALYLRIAIARQAGSGKARLTVLRASATNDRSPSSSA